MTPYICQVKHNPPFTYGDCFRACVASLLDMEPPEVPHFFYDSDCDGFAALREWLATLGYAPFLTAFGGVPLSEFLDVMAMNNPTTPYILIGGRPSGDHAMIYRGAEKLHDPGWIKQGFTGPASDGNWSVVIIGVL